MNGFLSNFSRDALTVLGFVLAVAQMVLALAALGTTKTGRSAAIQRPRDVVPPASGFRLEGENFWTGAEGRDWKRALLGGIAATGVVVALYIAAYIWGPAPARPNPWLVSLGALLALVQFFAVTLSSVVLIEQFVFWRTGHHWCEFPLLSWQFLAILCSLLAGIAALPVLASALRRAKSISPPWLQATAMTYETSAMGWIVVISLFVSIWVLFSLLCAIPSSPPAPSRDR